MSDSTAFFSGICSIAHKADAARDAQVAEFVAKNNIQTAPMAARDEMQITCQSTATYKSHKVHKGAKRQYAQNMHVRPRLGLGKWRETYYRAAKQAHLAEMIEDCLAQRKAQNMRLSVADVFLLADVSGYPLQALEIIGQDGVAVCSIPAKFASQVGDMDINAQDLRAGFVRVIPAA